MKAQEIMMFLLIFNLVVSLVGGLHIYNTTTKVPDEFNVSNYEPSEDNELNVWRFLGENIIVILMGAIGGALLASWTAKIPSDAGAAYGVFGTLFVSVMIRSSATLWRLAYLPGATEYNIAILMLIFIFLGVTGIIFAMGLLQMIRGGWKGYK